MFMYYYKYADQHDTMPKFVLYSAHAETVAPIIRAFNFWPLLTPDPASMVLVNFYEQACPEDIDQTSCIQVEGVYVPHWRIKKEVRTLFSYPVETFEHILNFTLDKYIQASGVKTRDVETMCKEHYEHIERYADPWKFREALYLSFQYDPNC